jgi:hypothetical protein
VTQNELAAFLGISGQMVSKLKRRGMPTHSVFAARDWRQANLDPSLVKEIRRPELIRALPQRDPVVECNELGALALQDLEAGSSRDFVQLIEELRAAMRLLTSEQEARVLLDTEIWNALCGQPGRWTLLSGLTYESRTMDATRR